MRILIVDDDKHSTVALQEARRSLTNEYGRFLKVNRDVEERSYWGDRHFNQARQPVVGVTWEDAHRAGGDDDALLVG